MNQLLAKFYEYKSIVNYKFVYELSNGEILEYRLRQTEFPHLLGLHKLTDIPVIQQFRDPDKPNISAKYILSRIKKEELLTDDIVRASSEFQKIQDRYDSFTKENLLTLSYTDVIIDFDPALVGSSLRAKYILFEKKITGGYTHLCIGCGKNGSYAESFFYQPSDRYIVNQHIFSVHRATIYDNRGHVYLQDSFDSSLKVG